VFGSLRLPDCFFQTEKSENRRGSPAARQHWLTRGSVLTETATFIRDALPPGSLFAGLMIFTPGWLQLHAPTGVPFNDDTQKNAPARFLMYF